MGFKETWRIKIWKNLTVRWMLAIGIIVLPINVFILVTTAQMTALYEERITESYENQLSIYTDNLSQELIRMKEQVEAFLGEENRVLLTVGTSDAAVDMVRINNQLVNLRSRTSLPGLGYIWNGEGDYVSVFRQGNAITPAEAREVKDYLEQREKSDRMSTENEYIQVGNQAQMAMHYQFPRFSFGLLYDVESVLRNFYENNKEPQGQVRLLDSEGKLLAEYTSEGFAIFPRGQEETSGQKNAIMLTKEIAFGGLAICYIVDNKVVMQAIPRMMGLLRVLALFSLIAYPLLIVFSRRLVILPLWKLNLGMKEVEQGNWEYQLTEAGNTVQMEYLYSQFNHMVGEIHTLIKESYEKEIEILRSEAVNIRLQVNQHMMLNFLNTIYYLNQAGKKEQTGEFVFLMMKYFRYILRQDIGLVRVKEEILFIQDYLRMQRIRFPDSFTSVYSVEPEAEELQIPQLLIENFVENAIKYALVLDSEIEILINVRLEEDMLCISVCDTGRGMEPDVLAKLEKGEILEDKVGRHIGIWNCRKRMKLYYGENYELKLTSRLGEGTQVWIRIPKEPLPENTAALERHLRTKEE